MKRELDLLVLQSTTSRSTPRSKIMSGHVFEADPTEESQPDAIITTTGGHITNLTDTEIITAIKAATATIVKTSTEREGESITQEKIADQSRK